MGKGIIEEEAFESGRATLEIVDAEDYEGTAKQGPNAGEAFQKANFEYKVIDYEDSDEDDGYWVGHKFVDGAYYKQDREGDWGVPARGKLPNLITAAKGEDYFSDLKAGKVEFEPEDLVGCKVRGTVEANASGYSSLFWKGIKGVGVTAKKAKKAKKAVEDLEEQSTQDMDEAETRATAQSIKDRITGKAKNGPVVDEELAKDENNPLMKEEGAA